MNLFKESVVIAYERSYKQVLPFLKLPLYLEFFSKASEDTKC